MKSKRLHALLLVFVVLFLPTVIFAQSVTVTGKITDNKDGAPLQGATISVKNSKTSTVSDTKGNFSIKAPSSESVITITYIGYGVYESKAGNGSGDRRQERSSEHHARGIPAEGGTASAERHRPAALPIPGLAD